MIQRRFTAHILAAGTRDAALRGWARGAASRWNGVASADGDGDLVDTAVRGQGGVAVALPGQGAQRPRAGGGEEPELAGRRGDDLGGELAGGAAQAHVRAADGAVAV